jgi:predicted ATPase/class 3 adenylate cyclase
MRFCGDCGTRLSPVDGPAPAQPHTTGDDLRSVRVETGVLQPRHSPAGRSTTVGPSIDSSRMGVMTGADLLERFKQAGIEAAGQRRNVTVLFVDLTGYSHLSEELSDEVLYDLVQRFIRVLADDVYKYEGMVDKFTGDGLMALFGAPIAYENNAERAIRSAIDMQADVARLSEEIEELHGRSLRVHIGLNAGSVIVGGIGSDAYMNYTAIGDVVNLARRLEETADGGTILVSESVQRQTRRLFDFETLAPRHMKGIQREVTAYRVIGAKEKPGSVRGLDGLRAPMIGRENELNQMMSMADSLVKQRQGGVVLLLGEAGMGKSRLTAELRAGLNPVEVRILEGHSLTYRKSIAYWIFQDVLRNYLGVTADTPANEIQQRLTDEVKLAFGQGSEWRERLPYLEHLLAIEPSDLAASRRIQYLDAGQLRQQIFLAVRDLLVVEARRKPILLILEDLHWADDASLELLSFLLESTLRVPLLIYAISRPFEGGAVQAVRERARQRLANHFLLLHLQALPPDQSKQLFHALLTIPDLPEALREGIIQRAAGSPFYLEEILRMLIENNVIYLDGIHWRMSPGADPGAIGVPDTLQGLILTRFDRLPPVQRRVLQTAAVIGYQFSADVLGRVLEPMAEVEISSALEWLQEREFIRPEAGSFGAEFIFKHVLVSDAVYSTLLQRDRRELHSRVGEAIETLYAGRLDNQVELLASHFLRSPLLDRALRYLILAGEKAARDFANEQARQHYVQALGLLPRVQYSQDQALQIHMGLGDALVIAGEYQAARDHYQMALEQIGDQADDAVIRQRSVLLRKVGITFERQGDYEKSLARLYAAEQVLAGSQADFLIERANIFNDIGWIHSRRGNLEQAGTHLLRALDLAEQGSQLDVIASILNRLGGICYQRGDLSQAARYLARSLELREKIGDIVAVARSYNNLGLLCWRQSDLDGALNNFNHALRLQSNLGDVEGQLELQMNIGLIEIDRGNLPEAGKHIQEALESAESIGHSYYVGYANEHLSLLYNYQGQYATALKHGQKSLASFNEIGVQDHLVDVHTFIGQASLGLADLTGAQESARMVLSLLDGGAGRGTESEGRALRMLGGLACAHQDWKAAQSFYERSEQVFTQVGNQVERARTLLELSNLAATCGQAGPAVGYQNDAREILTRLGVNL